ncbi:MAG TPA: PAS domain S-box protein [Clostridia bacterium]|nr:PAS domain S-box protein [Clostridia bacterium]
MSQGKVSVISSDGETQDESLLSQRALHRHNRLQEAEARLAAIVESSEDPIISKSLEGRITSWNAAAERVFGYSAEKAIGQPVSLILFPEYISAEADMRARIRRGERINHCEIPMKARGDRRVEMALTVSPVRDKMGRITGVSTILRDITQLKKTEEALRRSETYFRELVDAVPEIVWVAKPDGSLDYYNKRWYEFTGLQEGADDLNDWKSVLAEDDVQRCLTAWQRAVESGQPLQIEFRLKNYRTNQYRWHLGRALPLRDEKAQIIRWFGTCTDIEDQKRAEITLSDAREHLEAAVQERTAELEAFCYSLSHDLRAPMRAIHSYLEILFGKLGNQIGPLEKEFMQRSISAARRMDYLIQDVLAFSRLSRAEIGVHVVDVDKLVREIIRERQEFQPPRAEVHIEGSLDPMIGHEALLTQCITNLLSNAVKYVERGVKPHVHVYSRKEDDRVRLWVEDNGIGIRPEAQHRLFRLFQRLHRETDYEGTGVGLAIVRKAVERMGGQAGVESEEGKGSRFWVELKGAP